jgi:hypothetical protein
MIGLYVEPLVEHKKIIIIMPTAGLPLPVGLLIHRYCAFLNVAFVVHLKASQ